MKSFNKQLDEAFAKVIKDSKVITEVTVTKTKHLDISLAQNGDWEFGRVKTDDETGGIFYKGKLIQGFAFDGNARGWWVLGGKVNGIGNFWPAKGDNSQQELVDFYADKKITS